MVVLAHASNVTGTLLPIAQAGAIARRRDALLLVDAAQTAGAFPIDVEADAIDLLAITGHKSLYGPMGFLGGLSLLAALLTMRRSTGAAADAVPVRNPFSLTSAGKFGLLFAAILLLVKGVQRFAPALGFNPVAALAGLTDVDAITLSMADYAKTGGSAMTAITAITIASLTNTIAKAALVAGLGTPPLRNRVAIGTLVLAAATVGILLVLQ